MINETENPWKTTNTECVYESAWIKVVKNDIIHPSGNPGIYSVVHFKNIAIGILPLDDDYNTWIVGQYRYPLDAYSWEIPEGGGKKNIDTIESAKRELLEETGIKATTWIKIQEMHLSNSATDEFAVIYIVRNLSFHESSPEESEQLVVKKICFDDLYQMVKKGEITDSLTVAAVLKAKLMMAEGEL